jgi:Putative zincin peptidase
MAYSVEDLEDQKRFRIILKLSYTELIPFIFDHLKKKTGLTYIYWSACFLFLCFAVIIRIRLEGSFTESGFLTHSAIGLLALPVIFIPIHEFFHVIPYYFSGAKNIRVGMDLRQYLFYVTAHRYVASPFQFWIVALTPVIIISTGLIAAIILIPGLWRWSLSLFLFVHATMCAGDMALLNFYFLNKSKSIYTWDDADKKEAYFYEKIS